MRRPGPLVAGAIVIIVLLALIAGGQTVAAQLAQGPEQPIAFTHTTHAGALGLDCTFCHRNVTKGANASVPAVEQCMFCHRVVTLEGSARGEEVAKVRQAFQNGNPIDWVRVHRVPDHVRFVHEAHIRAGFGCETCHGEVQKMQRVAQVRPLKMGDCVSCHRQNNAPTDCTTCHK